MNDHRATDYLVTLTRSLFAAVPWIGGFLNWALGTSALEVVDITELGLAFLELIEGSAS
jgi:hypothetical protein